MSYNKASQKTLDEIFNQPQSLETETRNIFEDLIDSLAFFKKSDKSKLMSFIECCNEATRECDIVSKIRKSQKAINHQDQNGKSALFYLIDGYFSYREIQVCLEVGADASLTDRNGQNSLSYLLDSDQLFSEDLIKQITLLAQWGAEAHSRDIYGNSALDYARAFAKKLSQSEFEQFNKQVIAILNSPQAQTINLNQLKLEINQV